MGITSLRLPAPREGAKRALPGQATINSANRLKGGLPLRTQGTQQQDTAEEEALPGREGTSGSQRPRPGSLCQLPSRHLCARPAGEDQATCFSEPEAGSPGAGGRLAAPRPTSQAGHWEAGASRRQPGSFPVPLGFRAVAAGACWDENLSSFGSPQIADNRRFLFLRNGTHCPERPPKMPTSRASDPAASDPASPARAPTSEQLQVFPYAGLTATLERVGASACEMVPGIGLIPARTTSGLKRLRPSCPHSGTRRRTNRR